jgi:hypothetical protein
MLESNMSQLENKNNSDLPNYFNFNLNLTFNITLLDLKI